MRPQIATICAFQRATLCLAVAGLLTLAGCGDGKIARYPVSGVVNIDGRPAEGAILFFCPEDAGPEVRNLRPSGTTDAQGAFQLITIEPRDGAPAGKYKVIVKWPAPPAPGSVDRDTGRSQPGPDRLKGKYYDIDRSPFSVTVEKKSNQLPPFELTSK